MKLQTTLKLSALAIALGTSATVFAGYELTSYQPGDRNNGDIDITAGHSYTDRWNNPVHVGGDINLTANSYNDVGGQINLNGSVQNTHDNSENPIVGMDNEGNETSTIQELRNSIDENGFTSTLTTTVNTTVPETGDENNPVPMSENTSISVSTTTIKGGEIATGSVQIQQTGSSESGPTKLFSISALRDNENPNARAQSQEEIFSVDSNGVVAVNGELTIGGVNVGQSINNLNSRLDDVEKTAYRGVAIALAAQQNVPNIKPGQFAVFGGVGHYEGESAGALGVVGAINDRTSLSAAFGIAGSNEVGGRVGVAYVFGGN